MESYSKRLDDLKAFRNILINAEQGWFPEDFNEKIGEHVATLVSMATAIGYSALFRDISLDPQLGPASIKKEGFPSKNLVCFILDMKSGNYLVPSIGKAFPSRLREDMGKVVANAERQLDLEVESENIQLLKGIPDAALLLKSNLQTPLTDADTPKKGLNQRFFTLNSYVSKGIAQGISMRAHASGSAPVTLAGLQYINSAGNTAPIDEDEQKLAILAGMVIAAYECGDYHSPTETTAGICHFHQEARKEEIYTTNTSEEQNLEQMSPRNFLAISIGFLNNIVADEKLSEFNRLTASVLEKVKEDSIASEEDQSKFSSEILTKLDQIIRTIISG